MEMNPIETFKFSMENANNELVVIGKIQGKPEIPSLDDLKFKGIIALLNSIDKQNFTEVDKDQLFLDSLKEIEETIGEMKKYNEFQCREGLT
ncbi:hypothetical protein SAMN05518871_109103 [Psychrobacillus sp. OK028]|uniref:hypothetical protein n=1 Tax=Psychrobacillus sp. OK028 TaxID=1884359 RepID=UPI0008856CFD|nr:hypothetical protein [Psychrobacillus sp. OK028]SDO01301.1 hypothetical protein SAMN05518871_109103 [Psychrobacillus sp. OK028]